jgi:hypothetical protein
LLRQHRLHEMRALMPLLLGGVLTVCFRADAAVLSAVKE